MDNITIQNTALANYTNNMNYFQNNFPTLYQKLHLLTLAIESEQYKENFSLEYKENYFDIQNIYTNEWLYDENSIVYSERLNQCIDKKKAGGIFEAQRYVDYSPEMPDIIDKSELHFHNALWASIKIIDYVKKNANKNTTSLKNVYKSIFIGVGLGLHIESIIDKLGSKVVFIFEKNLELFRCSLFCIDYSRIAKKSFLFFSIMDTDQEIEESFTSFLEKGNNYNLYLKYIPFDKDYEKRLKFFQTINLKQNHIAYPYSAYLLRYINNPQYIVKNGAFIKINQRYCDNIMSKYPVLLVFSGPSTQKNVTWLKNNSSKFIIITALSTCRFLYKNDIKPDIIIHQDPGESTTLSLLDGIESSFFDDTIFIASANVYHKVIEKFDFNKIYFIQQESNYKYNFGNFGSLTAGEYTYGLALVLGSLKLYLLGIDLALDAQTYQTHSEGHSFSEQIKNEESVEVDKNIIHVKGNFTEYVPTLPTYNTAINEFVRFTHSLKLNSQEAYNLSDGAYLEGSIPLRSSDVPINHYPMIDKKDLHRELICFFSSISSKEFRLEDRQEVESQLHMAKNLLKIIKKYEKVSFTLASPYLDSLAKLSYLLSDRENSTNSYLSEVYYYYFKVILSYIYDLFNTTELTQTQKHIKEIHSILITQLYKIGKKFTSQLESYLH